MSASVWRDTEKLPRVEPGLTVWSRLFSDTWALVALVERLPKLSDHGFRQCVEQAGDGKHDPGHADGPTAQEPDAHNHDHRRH